jgi:hypothetical protein
MSVPQALHVWLLLVANLLGEIERQRSKVALMLLLQWPVSHPPQVEPLYHVVVPDVATMEGMVLRH